MRNTNKEDIIKLFVAGNGRILDDNFKDTFDYEAVGYALVEFVSESRPLSMIIIPRRKSKGQSLNRVYINNDKLHVSMESIGMFYYGTIIESNPDNINKNNYINYLVNKYNNEQAVFEGRKIKRLYFPDGTILEAN